MLRRTADASADSAEPAAAIPKQTTASETPSDNGKGSPLLTEVEPLLLLLFGSVLFAVATGIKLKLSRVNRASNQYFSQPASRSETSS